MLMPRIEIVYLNIIRCPLHWDRITLNFPRVLDVLLIVSILAVSQFTLVTHIAVRIENNPN